MRMLICLIVSTLFISSCNQKECCAGIPGDNAIFEISVVNDLGEDLLDPENADGIEVSSIRLFDENGNLIFNNMLDDPYGYDIVEWESTYRIRPFFDLSEKLDVIGYIRWNDLDYDTLQLSLVQQSKYTKRLTKIIYNEVEVWDEETSSTPDYRYFQIVK